MKTKTFMNLTKCFNSDWIVFLDVLHLISYVLTSSSLSVIFGNSSFLKHICRILTFYLHCRVGTF